MRLMLYTRLLVISTGACPYCNESQVSNVSFSLTSGDFKNGL